jgi:hypothetical protein
MSIYLSAVTVVEPGMEKALMFSGREEKHPDNNTNMQLANPSLTQYLCVLDIGYPLFLEFLNMPQTWFMYKRPV